MEPGGCLWCDYQVENSELTVDGSLDTLFDEPMVEEDKKTVDECCICYETIDTKKNNCVTECGHRFCFKCLATAMMNNKTCPCCRSPLVESTESDDEEDEEYESDDETEMDQQYEDSDAECEIQELSARLEANGFKMQDILSMLLGRYVKGSSDAVIYEMNKKFDAMVDEADNEVEENIEMGKEDLHSNEVVMV
jgi:hypothetical protein